MKNLKGNKLEEVWKRILNTKNHYEISNLGNIRLFRYNKIKNLKSTIKSNGYLHICIEGKMRTIHRLVLETFRPVANMKDFVVNHIDGDKTNNNILNLEWCTQKYNIAHSKSLGRHYHFTDKDREISKDNRLNAVRKKVLCIETNEIFESLTAAAKAKKTYAQNISHCCNKKLNSAGGYHWKYAV